MNKNPKHEHLLAHRYKPGQSGNKAGRPKSYLTVLKELGYTKPVIATMVAEIAFMKRYKVQELRESQTEPAIKVGIARAFYLYAYHGDYKYISDLMNLLWKCQVPYVPEGDILDNKSGTLSEGNTQPDKIDEQ